MFYTWSNQNKMQTLKVSGENDILTFEANGEKAVVYIKDNDIEKVVCEYDEKQEIIGKDKCFVVTPGEGNTQRDVYHFCKPGGLLPTMRLGITRHRGVGSWSSLPHDFELKTEPGFEEVFFHILEGGPKRAVQLGKGVWPDNAPVDSSWFVFDKTFSAVPMGYHPVVGEPGVKVAYVWAYLAKKPDWEKIHASDYIRTK